MKAYKCRLAEDDDDWTDIEDSDPESAAEFFLEDQINKSAGEMNQCAYDVEVICPDGTRELFEVHVDWALSLTAYSKTDGPK